MDENPGVKFGEISRIVAERWRGMSDADKQVGDLNNFTRLYKPGIERAHLSLCRHMLSVLRK